MRKYPILLLIVFSLLCILPGAENPNDSGLSKDNEPVPAEAGTSTVSAQKASDPPHTPAGPDQDQLRNLAFEEPNPDFSFPGRKRRYFYQGVSQGNNIALTFDDGPNAQFTSPLLALLREKKVPATFFLLGENVRLHPQIVKEIRESDCEVGNHSFSHMNLGNATPEKIREELEKTQFEIQKACGILPMVLRVPYGVSGEQVARAAFELKMDLFFWSIDTNDYKKTVTKDDIVKIVLKDAKGGSLILMHDNSQKVLDAVKEIIDLLREKGLNFVTCSELAREARTNQLQKEKNQEGNTNISR